MTGRPDTGQPDTGRPEDGPRRHHYLFAHRYLPGLVFNDAARFFVLLRQHGQALLHYGWTQAAEPLAPDLHLPADGLDYAFFAPGEPYLAAIITLPPPLYRTEAYFVAAVIDLRLLGAQREAAAPPRYLTLELGFGPVNGAPCGVYGEWTRTGAHLFLHVTPAPTLEGFRTHIQQMLFAADISQPTLADQKETT